MSPAPLSNSRGAIAVALPLTITKTHRVSKAIPIVKPAEENTEPTLGQNWTQSRTRNKVEVNTPSDAYPIHQSQDLVQSPVQNQGNHIELSMTHIDQNHSRATPGSIPSSQTISPATAFSVYANSYVPKNIRAINELPAQLVPTGPLPGIDYNQYVSNFAGRQFVSPSFASSVKKLHYMRPILRLPDTLTPETYRSYWTEALNAEENALREECDQLALWNVLLSFDGDLVLILPGLAEGRLRIEVEDQVSLRQLWWDPTRGFQNTFIGFDDLEHVALVKAIDRRQETLRLRVSRRFRPESLRCNIRFRPQERLSLIHI